MVKKKKKKKKKKSTLDGNGPMLRNRYSRIQHRDKNTKRKSNTGTKKY